MTPRDLIEKDLIIMTLPPDLKADVIDQLRRNAEKEIFAEARSRISKEQAAEFDKLLGVVDQGKIEAFLVDQVPQYFALVTQVTKSVLERFKLSLKQATEIHSQVNAQSQAPQAPVAEGEAPQS
jgi:hypothetical protein